MYCGNGFGCDLQPSTTALREGKYGLESVMHAAGVDIYVGAHEHDYERMFDVYRNTTTRSMTDPPATVHITTGAGGSDEMINKFQAPRTPRVAKQLPNFGYSVFTALNRSHLQIEFIMTDYANRSLYGSVQDSAMLVQRSHGPRPVQLKTDDEQRAGGATDEHLGYSSATSPVYGDPLFDGAS